MNGDKTKKLTQTAMFLAMGMVLPMLTGQIPQIGSMLLPMHIPVFLCAFVCGAEYAVPMAAALPIVRSLIFSRPNMYPEAISIAFEMACYAFVAGLLWSRARHKCIRQLYQTLIVSMLLGRVVRIAVQLALMGLRGSAVSFSAVFGGVVMTGIPGIVLQLVLIPSVMLLLGRAKATPIAAVSHKAETKQV